MSDSLWPHRLLSTRLLCSWNSPGKNTGVGSHPLLQRIFWTQGSNLNLHHCGQILYRLSHQEAPIVNIYDEIVKPTSVVKLKFLKSRPRALPLLVCVSHSVMSDSTTPWTVACQAPLSKAFSRQEYWNGLPFSSPKWSRAKANRVLPREYTGHRIPSVNNTRDDSTRGLHQMVEYENQIDYILCRQR